MNGKLPHGAKIETDGAGGRHLVIPDGVNSIGQDAFAHNQLTSVTIPPGLTEIGEGAFRDNRLASVVIPSSVQTIGDYAFGGNRLTGVRIPDSVKRIGDYAFAGNPMKSVRIPDSVEYHITTDDAHVEAWVKLAASRKAAQKYIKAQGVRAAESVALTDPSRSTTRELARKYRRRTAKRADDAVTAIRNHIAIYREWSSRRTVIGNARMAARRIPDRPSLRDRHELREAEFIARDDQEIWDYLIGHGNGEVRVVRSEDHRPHVAHADVPDWDYHRLQSSKYRNNYPPRRYHIITAYIPPGDMRALPGGVRDLQGLMTLSASPVPSPEGDAWEAKWMSHGRGYSWSTESGYIVRIEGGRDGQSIYTHGTSVTRALATARRRRTSMTAPRKLPRDMAGREHFVLNWSMARAAGMCETGIRSWVMRHFPGLDPLKDTITIQEALQVRSQERLVRAVIRHALSCR